MKERILIDNNFDCRVTYGTAKVVVSLNVYLNLVSQTKGFFLSILFGSCDCDLKLRKLVLLESKQPRTSDRTRVSILPELNVVLAERKLVSKFE